MVVLTCPECSAESPQDFRFCPGCGSPLSASEPARRTRKVVTALFCDVAGSTALAEQLDPEILGRVLGRYFGVMRETIERHGGSVEKFIGDAVMAVFGIPRVHEDDALRAVRAAAEIRERLPAVAREVGVELRFRTGVNTGRVMMGAGGSTVIGDAINVAARLEQAAAPGEILLGDETLRLVRDAVRVEPLDPLRLKGKSEPVPAYRLVSVDPTSPGVARHFDVALVDRERELTALEEAWERSVRASSCQLFTVIGAAGVGKSRLVSELLTRLGDRVTVLTGRCLHYGEGITFWPVVEALSAVGSRAHEVVARLGSGTAARPEELFWDVRELLESLARERPVLLHVDDLQWAEALLLDLLEHVIDLSRQAPILVLCTARSGLFEYRPEWGAGQPNATTVLLDPFGPADSRALLERLGDRLDPVAQARVVTAGDGNPLFLLEMAALAQERGTVEMPPTIQALLAARIEHLDAEERELLEHGAVEGEVFHRDAIEAMASERLARRLDTLLAGLVRKELVRAHPPAFRGEQAFRFRHILIRDAAYDLLAKATRAELHERFAAWLEEQASDVVEFDELAGWHQEQAVRYARELGERSDPELSARAARHLHIAGHQASRRADAAGARNLLERALELASTDAGRRALVAIDLAAELLMLGEQGRVDELLTSCESDPEVAARAALLRLEWQASTGTTTLAEIEPRLTGLLAELAAAGDEHGLARAHMLGYRVNWVRSHAAAAGREARLAAEHAERAGDEGLKARALAFYVSTMIFGPAHVRSFAAELEWVASVGRGGILECVIEWGLSTIARLEGRLVDARRHAEAARDAGRALGAWLEAGGWDAIREVEVLEGNLDGALAALERCDAIFEQTGETALRSTVLARIADLHAVRGEPGAALDAIARCEALSAAEDAVNFALTNGARARLSLLAGDVEAAARSAAEAVEHAFSAEFPWWQAYAKLGQAEAFAAAGRRQEAIAAARDAIAVCAARGDRPWRERAQAVLDEL